MFTAAALSITIRETVPVDSVMYSIKNYTADGVDSMNLVEGERVFVIGKTQIYMHIP
jgi:hypothetical protein